MASYGLVRYNKLNGIRSFSVREKWLPIIFMIVGGFLVPVGIGLAGWMLTHPAAESTEAAAAGLRLLRGACGLV